MSLFGKRRDISLFRHLNRELINKWIQQDVGIYKLALDHTEANLYGEADNKVYYRPVKVHCLVGRDEQSYASDEFGQDYVATATFAFLRDDLKLISLVPEVGDIIVWDNEYYELDSLVENQYFVGKNPETGLSNDHQDWGWNTSLVFSGHITRRSRINLVDRQQGNNTDTDYRKDA